MPAKKDSRCWPGYEPVKGKEPHSQGSCRPKADSKLSSSEKSFRAKRKKQLDEWNAEHKGAPRQSAQHLHAPGAKPKAKRKKASSAAAPNKAAGQSRSGGTRKTKSRKRAGSRARS